MTGLWVVVLTGFLCIYYTCVCAKRTTGVIVVYQLCIWNGGRDRRTKEQKEKRRKGEKDGRRKERKEKRTKEQKNRRVEKGGVSDKRVFGVRKDSG